jgi:TetR/AcrR family transcriptional regulator, transcriptional repressor for nem operon
MTTRREQKQESRAAIITAASKLFRERGVDNVSVAEVMDAAGMTHGGFPRHFASKLDLVGEALRRAADETGGSAASPVPFEEFAATYLSAAHRDHPGTGCVFAALGPEVSRGPAETRHVLADKIERQIAEFGDTPQQRAEAISRWATLIGTLILARLAEPDALSDEIIAAGRRAVGLAD